MSDFVVAEVFAARARNVLSDVLNDYIDGGAETETTVRRNREAIDRLAIRSRVLVDVSGVRTKTSFLGDECRLPLCLAPVGGLASLHPDGVMGVAAAARQFGVPAMLSSLTETSQSQFATAVGPGAMFQLYVRGRGSFIEEHIEQSIAAGMSAFCLVVDSAAYGRRERDIARRATKPWRQSITSEQMSAQASLTWKDVERIKSKFDIPLILKGISTPEDARIACDHGVDVVYVSNHGGRQLDHGQATFSVLPEIVETVAGAAKIIVDGGIYRGTDIVKALALGADMVGIGRHYCHALAAGGSPGVVRALEILEEEMRTTLMLAGVSDISNLSRDNLSATF